MKTPAKTLEDLVVWQKSHRLVLAVYRLTQAFPRPETAALPIEASKLLPRIRNQ